MLSKEDVTTIVNEEVHRINSLKESRDYRCYEMARLIARRLSNEGCEPRVRQGLAFYSLKFINGLLNLEKEEKVEKRVVYKHSWCELDEENLIIDRQQYFEVDDNRYINGFTLIENIHLIKELIIYEPQGIEIKLKHRNWVFIPPICLIKLRV